MLQESMKTERTDRKESTEHPRGRQRNLKPERVCAILRQVGRKQFGKLIRLAGYHSDLGKLGNGRRFSLKLRPH